MWSSGGKCRVRVEQAASQPGQHPSPLDGLRVASLLPRTGSECGDLQFLRELTVNGLDAIATTRRDCKNIRISRLAGQTTTDRADARTRTGDPFITSEVLYQLSYVGVCTDFLDFGPPLPPLVLQRCCKISVGLCCAEA